jgi:hypothetical protein
MGGACSTNGEGKVKLSLYRPWRPLGLREVEAPTFSDIRLRNAYRILAGKPEGKRPLGRPRCRWVDNIKMDLTETGWDGVEWIGWIWLRIGISGGLL